MASETAKTKQAGRVTARKCACCGHHEIGITTPEGEYIPLKPGIWVEVHWDKEEKQGK